MLLDCSLDKFLFMLIIFAVFIVNSRARIENHFKDNSTLFQKENLDIRIKRQEYNGNTILEII